MLIVNSQAPEYHRKLESDRRTRTEEQTDNRMDMCTARQTDKQRDRQTHARTEGQTDGRKDCRDRETERERETRTNRQTNKQKDRHTDVINFETYCVCPSDARCENVGFRLQLEMKLTSSKNGVITLIPPCKKSILVASAIFNFFSV